MFRPMIASLIVMLLGAQAGADSAKFHAASQNEPAMARYRVTLSDATPTEQTDAVTSALVGMYGLRLEPFAEQGFRGFVIVSTPARALRLSADARVALVEEQAALVNAPPPPPPTAAAPDRRTLTRPTDPVADFVAGTTSWDSGMYEYDGAGNIIAIGEDRYRYDGVNRLAEATANTESHENRETFTYDRYGNIRTVVTSTHLKGSNSAPTVTTKPFDVNENTNRLQGVVYDGAGNLIRGDATYTWDALGMMTSLTEGPLRKDYYVYDSSNERIAVIRRPTTTVEYRTFRVRGPNNKVLREYQDEITGSTHKWSWTKDYVYRGGLLLASVTPVAGSPGATETRHFHLDHLGTPRVVTNDKGYREGVYTYTPFGENATGSTFDYETMKFTGHERDFGWASGDLDYMHARYYSPGARRFLSPDPVSGEAADPSSWNRYSYVRNQPISLTDPDGRLDLGRATGIRAPDLVDLGQNQLAFVLDNLVLEIGFGPKFNIKNFNVSLQITADVINAKTALDVNVGFGPKTSNPASAKEIKFQGTQLVKSGSDGAVTPAARTTATVSNQLVSVTAGVQNKAFATLSNAVVRTFANVATWYLDHHSKAATTPQVVPTDVSMKGVRDVVTPP